MEVSRLTRDGTTAEPVSRDQIIRGERGQGNISFPCSADHEQDWQSYPVDPFSCYSISVCDHTWSPWWFSWKPRIILTLGREFESRCCHTNWDFPSQKKNIPYPMRDRKRRSKTENVIFHFSIWTFRAEEKNYLMRSDFDDFREVFFVLAFSIATLYRNGGDFRSEKMAIEKCCATKDTKACAWLTHKNKRKHQRYGNTHTRAQRLISQKYTKEH